MAEYVIADDIDQKYSTTVSKTLASDYLHGKLGFDGIIMAEVMRIKMVQNNYGTGAVSMVTVWVRRNLILLHGDFNYFSEGDNAILAAVKNGEISEKTIDTCVLRILKAKGSVGLFETDTRTKNRQRKL